MAFYNKWRSLSQSRRLKASAGEMPQIQPGLTRSAESWWRSGYPALECGTFRHCIAGASAICSKGAHLQLQSASRNQERRSALSWLKLGWLGAAWPGGWQNDGLSEHDPQQDEAWFPRRSIDVVSQIPSPLYLHPFFIYIYYKYLR